MRLLRHDLHSLSGAYVLDALEPGAERDRFTRHLSRCQSCASEVRGFREVATALAFATVDPSTEPPAELRDRVLAAAERTRQLPPEIMTHARPRRTRSRVPWVPWLSGVVATASIETDRGDGPEGSRCSRQIRLRLAEMPRHCPRRRDTS